MPSAGVHHYLCTFFFFNGQFYLALLTPALGPAWISIHRYGHNNIKLLTKPRFKDRNFTVHRYANN